MANHLKMALIETIFTLHQRGWSGRRIARELGIDRGTVARYLRSPPPAKSAIAPTGSDILEAGSKPAIAPTGSDACSGTSWGASTSHFVPVAQESTDQASGGPGGAWVGQSWGDGTAVLAHHPPGPPDAFAEARSVFRLRSDPPTSGSTQTAPAALASSPPRRGRPSDCEPLRGVIVAKLEQELTAQRIYQDLVSEHGFPGSYYSVRRFILKLGGHQPLPFRRLECAPGEEAQVDFGTGAWIRTAEGKRRRSHVFRIVLSHSRKGYSEAVFRQTTDDFIRCLENAFWHFGGVPRRLVLDNLKAAISQADWFDPEVNPKFASFCQHYGLVAWPTRPRTPRHKGKVERGVGYVQDNGLKGREFASLEEENRHLASWESSVADTRIHGTTRHQVGKHFQEVERHALQPLPTERFPFFHEGQRIVNRDGHIEVDRAYYSVPPEFLARRVWVRWDSRLVRIFTAQMEPIRIHIKREPGRFSTHRQDIASEKISAVEHGAEYLLTRIRRLGVEATRWAENMMQQRGIEGLRVLQGLWSLTKRYSSEQLGRACQAAHAHGCYRLRTVRALLQRQPDQQTLMPFLDEHPLIRPLSAYGQFIHHALHKEISQ